MAESTFNFTFEHISEKSWGKLASAICKVIEWISLPISIVAWFWRHKSILNILKWVTIFSLLVLYYLGIATLIGIFSFAGRLAYAAVFMIAQFAFLFAFLSSTKNIESVPGDKGLVNFKDDYFGNAYLVDSVRQWVGLMTPDGREKLDAMGSEAISGIMLTGEPGTGKTLLAMCLASDGNMAFIGISGTDFQAMFIGVGPMKVKSISRKGKKWAREYGSCIIFIDEADAVGGNRGGVAGDKNQPQGGGMGGGMFGGGGLGVLSTLLTEMDGTKEIGLRDEIQNKIRRWFGIPDIDLGVVLWMGATNRPDALDPAFVRPGRIDKIVPVDRPDNDSRKLIIEGYLRKVKHDDTVNVEALTYTTQGVTPAKISSAIQRGAARHAIYDGRTEISQKDIEAALQEDIFGLTNPIQGLAKEQEYQIAIHEAGHAVVSAILRPWKRITNVSIIRRGSGVLGYMRDVETEEVYSMPLSRMAATIQVLLAGHVATELILGEPWTGASSDIQHVQRVMLSMAMHGEFSTIPFKIGDPFEDKKIKLAGDVYIEETVLGTRQLLDENREFLLRLADELMEHKELSSLEFYAIADDFQVSWQRLATEVRDE